MASFEPCCLATALQGMAHTNVDRACHIVLQTFPEIPILPSLTHVGDMKGALQYCEGMPCLKIDEEKEKVYFDTSRNFAKELSRFYEKYLAQDLDSFASTPKAEPGFHAMLKVLQERRPPELQIIKFGVGGPITFTMRSIDQNNKPIFYNEDLREAVIKALVMKLKWYEKKLNEAFPGVQTMVNLGEPYLGMYGSAYVSIKRQEVLAGLTEMIGASSSFSFIHCCANTDWPLLMETGASAISFDAYEHAERVALYPEATKRYLEKGGILAWGIVPTSNDKIVKETPDSLIEKLEAAMELMVRQGFDKQLLVRRALITPSCATGAMTIPLGERVYDYTKTLAAEMRRRYFPKTN